MSSSREKILTRLKEVGEKRKLIKLEQPDMVAPIYHSSDKEIADWFQKNLELVGGNVLRVQNLSDAIFQLKGIINQEKVENIFCLDGTLQKALNGHIKYTQSPEDFNDLQAGVTTCEYLIAHLGSVLISSANESGRRLHVYPETHFIIAHENQIVNYLDDGLEFIQQKYHNNLPSMITNITGPSRTADIEKTLVKGMHGPRKLFVILSKEPF